MEWTNNLPNSLAVQVAVVVWMSNHNLFQIRLLELRSAIWEDVFVPRKAPLNIHTHHISCWQHLLAASLLIHLRPFPEFPEWKDLDSFQALLLTHFCRISIFRWQPFSVTYIDLCRLVWIWLMCMTSHVQYLSKAANNAWLILPQSLFILACVSEQWSVQYVSVDSKPHGHSMMPLTPL